jgi:outer membrane lipoprotein-sorting protein
MTVSSSTARRWSIPALAAAAVAAVVTAPHASAASAHPALPARTPAQLIAAVEQARVDALSGTVRTIANLGLPQLPDSIGNAGSGLQALLTGTNTLRVWVDGPEHQRLALLGSLAETDVIHSGTDLWTYSSRTNTVTHRTLPAQRSRAAGERASASPDAATPEQQLTPQAQADKALTAIDPTTSVTVDRTARVAGRPAYQLVLTPRTTATLVSSVRIAIDAATSVPLRVQVFAAGSPSPAFETGFVSIDFARPAASIFRFTAPRGAIAPAAPGNLPGPGNPPVTDHADHPTALGHGWTTILELPSGSLGSPGPGRPSALLDRAATPGPQGRLVTTRLLTVLVTPDGRVFVGAVPAAALEKAAAGA